MTDAVQTAIATQAASLATISVANGYQTDIGGTLLWPRMPADGDQTECIYRSGPISFESVRPQIVRPVVTWAAMVIAEPEQIDERALMVQSDLALALRRLCPEPVVDRQAIPARDAGSNVIVVAVSCTVGVPEPDPV